LRDRDPSNGALRRPPAYRAPNRGTTRKVPHSSRQVLYGPKMSDVESVRTRWAAVGAAVAVTLGAVGIGGYGLGGTDEVSCGDRPIFVTVNP
jgi:hypothetical protein